ncbi:MAG: NAD-dependent protein deacylase [Deltaproteobacteria bacterium]|nr:NAD-dependent protein deacylase [Deltaproteobacteria bacterium]
MKLKSLPAGAALTGSGVSAESGISTYRDKGGLWDTHPKGASGGMLGVLAAYPEKASQILGDFFGSLKRALPNPGHTALAEMEKAGFIRGIITQNVDDLHNRAGSRVVYELHGNVMRVRCMSCGKKERPQRDEFFEVAERLAAKASGTGLSALLGELPRCMACHGILRPDFVGFGEAVQDLSEAVTLAENCGFMLVCGTSGLVHPAASLPLRARERGALIVEINPGESALTNIADAVIRERSAQALPALLKLMTG